MRETDRNERRAEESTAEGARAAQSRDAPARVSSAPDQEPAEGVLTLACFKCGQEYFFEDDTPPEDVVCEKCGNTVFRSFFSPIDDEVAQDFEDSTARDTDPDDPETEVKPGDVIDLNRGG